MCRNRTDCELDLGPDGRGREVCPGHSERGKCDRNPHEVHQEDRGKPPGRRRVTGHKKMLLSASSAHPERRRGRVRNHFAIQTEKTNDPNSKHQAECYISPAESLSPFLATLDVVLELEQCL